MLFPYAKSSISLIFVKKTQFSSLKKRLFIAYITKILGGIFLVCKNLSFGIVKSKIDHFRKVPCEHTVPFLCLKNKYKFLAPLTIVNGVKEKWLLEKIPNGTNGMAGKSYLQLTSALKNWPRAAKRVRSPIPINSLCAYKCQIGKSMMICVIFYGG